MGVGVDPSLEADAPYDFMVMTNGLTSIGPPWSQITAYVYVAKIRFTTLKQPLPRNSDGGDLPDEDVMRVAHRDS
jgi:hypothetical protein